MIKNKNFLILTFAIFLFVGISLSFLPQKASAQLLPSGGFTTLTYPVCLPPLIPGSTYITHIPRAGVPFVIWTPLTFTYAYMPPILPAQNFVGTLLLSPVPCIASYIPYIQIGLPAPILFQTGASIPL